MVGKFPTIATSIHWAPKGTRCVAANYEKSILEFYSINASGRAVQQERVEFPSLVTRSGTRRADSSPSGRPTTRATTTTSTRIYDMNGVKVVEAKAEKLSHMS